MTVDMSAVVCRNVESAVLNVKIAEAWTVVRQLDFSRITPGAVKDCSLLVPDQMFQSSPRAGKAVSLEDVEYKAMAISEPAMTPFTCGAAVGSLRRVVYRDGAEFVFRVVELSDLQHSISYELIQTDATLNVSSVLHTLHLVAVTETDDTLVVWTTEFSGDCDPHVYSDAKFKKLDAFKDMRHVLHK